MPTPQYAPTFNDYHSLLESLRLEREAKGIQSQPAHQGSQPQDDGRGHTDDSFPGQKRQQQHEVENHSAHRIASNDANPSDAFDSVDMAARSNASIPAGADIRTATAHLARTLDQVIPSAPKRPASASSASSSSSLSSSSSSASSSSGQQTAALDSARRVNFALQTNAALAGGLVHSMGSRPAPPPLLPLDDATHSDADASASVDHAAEGHARPTATSSRDRESLSARSKQKMKLGIPDSGCAMFVMPNCLHHAMFSLRLYGLIYAVAETLALSGQHISVADRPRSASASSTNRMTPSQRAASEVCLSWHAVDYPNLAFPNVCHMCLISFMRPLFFLRRVPSAVHERRTIRCRQCHSSRGTGAFDRRQGQTESAQLQSSLTVRVAIVRSLDRGRWPARRWRREYWWQRRLHVCCRLWPRARCRRWRPHHPKHVSFDVSRDCFFITYCLFECYCSLRGSVNRVAMLLAFGQFSYCFFPSAGVHTWKE